MEKEYFQFYEGVKMGIKTIEDGVIIPAIYDFIEPYSDGLFNVKKDNTTAYFDANGKIVIPFQNKYESYGDFTEGLARVRISEKWGYIDKTGTEIIVPQFHYAEVFSDHIAIVRNTEDKYGAIDKTGKLIIGYQFKLLTNFENGYAKFGDHKTFGLIDTFGKIVVPQDFIHIGTVINNQVLVQLREGENYKEGILTLGGSVEWNNNLDELNQFNFKRKQFISMAEELIETMYHEGCPCEYQRFRNYIQWNKPVGFIDQQEIFYIFSKHLEKDGDNSFRCKSCGTSYLHSWEEYNIALQVVHVKITNTGNLIEKGAEMESLIPFALGFNGYELGKWKNKYRQTDNEIVMSYLKEKLSHESTITKSGLSWWQKLFK